MKNPAADGPILFFDGVCNLCVWWVDMLVRLDRRGRFRFASLQSEFAEDALGRAGFSNFNMNTVVLLAGGKVFSKSDAVLEVSRRLGGVWPVFYVFKVLPRPVRDFFYGLVSRNRYRFFGKKETCRLPTEAERGRFLG